MKDFKNNNGITLVALIITIIVMLILVGVTINLALNGGIFQKAKNASVQTQKEVEREQLINAMTGGYNNNGSFVMGSVSDKLPQGAKWCRETDTSFSDTPSDILPSDDGDWVITENNNKFFVDKYGRVLDEKPTSQKDLDKQELISIIAKNTTDNVPDGEKIIEELTDTGWILDEGDSCFECTSPNGSTLYVMLNGEVLTDLPESTWWYSKGLTSENVKYNKSYKGDNNDEIIISSDGGFTKYIVQGTDQYNNMCLENLESDFVKQFWGFALCAEENKFFWIDMSIPECHFLRYKDDKIEYYRYIDNDDDDDDDDDDDEHENMTMIQMFEMIIEQTNMQPTEIFTLQNN